MRLNYSKEAIDSEFIYLKSSPRVTGFYQYALFCTCLSASILYVQQIANVRVRFRVCACVCASVRACVGVCACVCVKMQVCTCFGVQVA